MKCQECEKPATFHITELTDVNQPVAVHLCEDCAKEYLAQGPHDEKPSSVAGAIAQQFKLHQTAEELAKLDQSSCPICGITFYEFRKVGRLGCPHDYDVFQEEMEPLIVNIHGAVHHTGKKPKRSGLSSETQTELMRLRRQMTEAVEKEDYELASQLRDKIRKLELGQTPLRLADGTADDNVASDEIGSDEIGSDEIGSDEIGSDEAAAEEDAARKNAPASETDLENSPPSDAGPTSAGPTNDDQEDGS
jgi:protein arginine kinase activator